MAHRETGAPITVHTNAQHQTGRLALDLFREEGVDLTKVVVGHSGDSNDLDYLKELMDTGATAGMDRFGLDLCNPTSDRVATIATLARQGYADRMVLSRDASRFIDYFPTAEAKAALTATVPNWHYTHIHEDVLPELRERGVEEAQIAQVLVDNPPSLFQRPRQLGRFGRIIIARSRNRSAAARDLASRGLGLPLTCGPGWRMNRPRGSRDNERVEVRSPLAARASAVLFSAAALRGVVWFKT